MISSKYSIASVSRRVSAQRAVSAFTLVELLVVIGIIALLIAILMPALSKARAQSLEVACASNLRQMGQAMTIYTTETKYYPRRVCRERGWPQQHLRDLAYPPSLGDAHDPKHRRRTRHLRRWRH